LAPQSAHSNCIDATRPDSSGFGLENIGRQLDVIDTLSIIYVLSVN
jgi:hypothetical protein